MKRTILALLLLGGATQALAQDPPAPPPPGGPMAAGMLMRADANGDGVVTRDEAIAAADARFDRMDANRDGTVTPEEMRTARDAMRSDAGRGPPPPPPPPGDGDRPRPPMPPEQPMTRDDSRARALAAFDRADVDHDGRIDGTEMAQLRGPGGPGRGGNRPGGDMPPPPQD